MCWRAVKSLVGMSVDKITEKEIMNGFNWVQWQIAQIALYVESDTSS